MVLPLQNQIVYGPIKSRRLGISLGLNILSPYQKICSFDCIYCQYGKTNTRTMEPDPASLYDMDQIIIKAEQALKLHPALDYITFSGNGEPTLHPEFFEIARSIKKLKEKYLPNVRLAIFSNATNLEENDVKKGLDLFDAKILKLDAADQSTFMQINQPSHGLLIESIIQELKWIPRVTIQSLFLKGDITNIESKAYENWLKAIADIRPEAIQIYSTDRPVPDKRVEKVLPYELMRIVDEVRSKLNISIEAFWPI